MNVPRICTLLVLSLAPAAEASSDWSAPIELQRSDGVARQGSAALQLSYAKVQKRKLRGQRGERRMQARREAISAYRAVRRYFPRERALGAEAAFRAGELLRSGHFDSEAVAEFEAARDLGKGTAYGPRGGLELAHIHRRHARLNDALSSYEDVTLMKDIDAEFADRARYWAGCVQAKLGRHVEARRSWERVARKGTGPIERITAFDAWIDSLVSAEDLEGAAGVLKLCNDELRSLAAEQTKLGLRVRNALERMTSVERLVRAVEQRAKRRREAGLAPRLPAKRAASSRCRSR